MTSRVLTRTEVVEPWRAEVSRRFGSEAAEAFASDPFTREVAQMIVKGIEMNDRLLDLLRRVSEAPRTGPGMGGMVNVRLDETLLARIESVVESSDEGSDG